MQHLRYVPTLTHALLDHLLGAIMIIAPWVFDLQSVRGPAVHVPMLLGGLLIVNSLITCYEMGLVKWLRIDLHMAFDAIIGVCLALSPWVLGFADRIFLPHLIGGIVIALLPVFSARKPFDESLFTEVVIKEGRAEVVRYARTTDNSI